MTREFIFILLLIISPLVHAKLNLPTGLSSGDETQILKIIGVSSSSKIVGNPYPLGGFSGFEVALSDEIIPVNPISALGSQVSEEDSANYYLLSLGKGLYHNIDIFFQATPFNQADGISNYGGQFRWSFYESTERPLYFSLLVGANGVNVQNLVTLTSVVLDLVAGYKVEHTTTYFILGTVQTSGQFVGGCGTGGITASCNTETSAISSNHFGGGLNFSFDPYFVAFEYDKYFNSTLAFKLGTRF